MTGGIELKAELDPASREQLATLAARMPGLVRTVGEALHAQAPTLLSRVRSTVLSGSYSQNTGLRAGIAANLAVEYQAGTHPQIRLLSNGEPGRQVMAKAWNAYTFHHPVYGGAERYAQAGHPYFNRPIWAGRPDLERAVIAAVLHAISH